MSLRLAAAKGGYEKIIAYWGILETAQKGLGTAVPSQAVDKSDLQDVNRGP
jgi:hypothetical protein